MLFLAVKLGLCTGFVDLDAREKLVVCLGSLWEEYECCFDRRSAEGKIHEGRRGIA